NVRERLEPTLSPHLTTGSRFCDGPPPWCPRRPLHVNLHDHNAIVAGSFRQGPRPVAHRRSRRPALLCPVSLASAGTPGSPLCRDSPADARTEITPRPRTAWPTLPGQAAAVLLAGDCQLLRVRRPRLVGAAGSLFGRLSLRAGDLRLGTPPGRPAR